MFIINTMFSVVSILLIVGIYVVLLRREMKVHSPDVRSGFLTFISEQMAVSASRLPYHPKIWKPNLLIPVIDSKEFGKVVSFVRSVIYPSGRITAFEVLETNKESLNKDRTEEALNNESLLQLQEILSPLAEERLFVEASSVESHNVYDACAIAMQFSKGMLFSPNTLFLLLNGLESDLAQKILTKAEIEGLGIICLSNDERVGLNRQKIINLWIRRHSPNLDLSILVALQLKTNWDGVLRLVLVVEDASKKTEAFTYLERMKKVLRLPLDVEMEVLTGGFQEVLTNSPVADINIFGMPQHPDINQVVNVSQKVRTAVLFLRDSKFESAVA